MTHESVDLKSDIQNGTKLGKSETDRLLGDVAGEFFDRISQGEQPQVEDYAQRYPQIAVLIRQMFPIIPQIDDSLQASEPSKKSVIEVSGQQRLGDFRILHPLGSGGMGVVYEAEQVSMGRHVALKILPMAGALQQKQLLRFRNEVRAAAMLDHPHIVSVYSIGEERGVHYYTMQLIRGQSMAEVIQDLRLVRNGDGPQRDGLTGDSIHQVLSVSKDRSDSAKESADQPTEEYSSKSSATPHNDQAVDATLANTPPPLAADTHPEVKGQISTAANTSHDHGFFRSAAKLGIQAAEALQHAHDLGVLHRDIKPGNLMLDAEAQLHITDFGLARIEADAGVTMTGDILGTLRYMSPEQALAKRVVIDQRSDIYSLGVTLYELLTLQPAFSGNNRQSLLQQIAFEEPKLPTRINRAIPRELETIVMKAIAKNPRERYATAQELADDLGRYLDDMPIQAKRPSLLRRTTKWTHRNKTFVRTTIATVAVAVVIGGALLWQQRSETLAALEQAEANLVLANKQEDLAKKNAAQAERERAVAQENFRQTRTAVDDYFTTVSQSKLLDVPDMAPLRQELLESAVNYYQTFAKEHANDPELAAELAAAHARLMHVYAQQGSNRWIGELAKTIDIVERLVDQGIDVSAWESLREGMMFRTYRGGAPQAEDIVELVNLCQRGIRIWKRLAEMYPTVKGFTSDLAGFYFLRGEIVREGVGIAESKPWFEKAVANWGKLDRDFVGPTRPYFLAQSYERLANAEANEQDFESAIRNCQRAVRILSGPDIPPELRIGNSAWFYRRLAEHASAQGRAELAIDSYKKSYQAYLETYLNLDTTDKPLQDMSYILKCLLRLDDSEEHAAEVLDIATQAIELVPTYTPFRQFVAAVWAKRVKYFADQGMDEESAEAKRKLVEVRAETLALIRNEFGNESREVADTLHEMAKLLAQSMGEPAAAEKAFQEAKTIYTQLIEDDPNDVDLWYGRGQVFAELGQWANASADFTKTTELKTDNFAPHYWGALTQLGAGNRDGYLSSCSAMLEQFAETEDEQTANFTAWSCALAADAVDDFSLPVRLAKRTGGKDTSNVFHLNTLGAVLYRAGRFDEALARLDEAESLQAKPDAQANSSAAYTWYFLAMTHYRLGHEEEARKWYDKAAAWTSSVLAPESEGSTPKPSVTWNRRLTLELLNNEVSGQLATPAEAVTVVTDNAAEDPDQ